MSSPVNEIKQIIKEETSIKKASYCLVILSACFMVNWNNLFHEEIAGEKIGSIYTLQGEGRIKYPKSMNWISLRKDTAILKNSLIYTGSSSLAEIRLNDGSIITQGSNTLLKINSNKLNQRDQNSNKKDDFLSIDISEGIVDINSKDNSQIKSLKIGDEEIELGEKELKLLAKNTKDKKNVQLEKGTAKKKENHKNKIAYKKLEKEKINPPLEIQKKMVKREKNTREYKKPNTNRKNNDLVSFVKNLFKFDNKANKKFARTKKKGDKRADMSFTDFIKQIFK